MARDEYASLYNHSQVIATSFRIDAVSNGSHALVVGYSVRRDSATTNGGRYIEMGETNFKILAPNDAVGGGKATLLGRVDIANELGLQPTNSTLESELTASPSELLYLHIFTFAIDATQDPNAVDLTLTMDFDTKFREKKILNPS